MEKIKKIIKHSVDELISKLKKISMLTRPNIYPYKEAYISLERIRVEYLCPTQYYILRSELEKIRQLRWKLLAKGIDIFDLNGYITLVLEDGYLFDLLPPIVEESFEGDGSMVLIINDGMHRLFLAYQEWIIPKVVYVRGVPKNLPYYAYPLRKGWEDVKIYDDKKEELGILKKFHRIENNKDLYRNFNSVFTNVSAPRGKITVPFEEG